jgi:hypothetical protein
MKIRHPLARHPITGPQFRAGLLIFVHQRNPACWFLRNRTMWSCRPGYTYLALTFGTLLSSQGADAHPSEPVGRTGGNPSNATRSGSRCQSRPSHPIGPVGLGPAPSGADEKPLSAAECTAPSAGDQLGDCPGPTNSRFPLPPVRFPAGKDKVTDGCRPTQMRWSGLPGRRPRRSGPPSEMNQQRPSTRSSRRPRPVGRPPLNRLEQRG